MGRLPNKLQAREVTHLKPHLKTESSNRKLASYSTINKTWQLRFESETFLHIRTATGKTGALKDVIFLIHVVLFVNEATPRKVWFALVMLL
jgi:hypothetical protein